MTNIKYKLVVYIPQTHLEQVRIVACNAGAGRIGKYDNCAFMTTGIGTYRPLKGAHPFTGEIDHIERVGEARLEITLHKEDIKPTIDAIKKVHPYEEPVIDIYKLESIS
jgi:hypothetical protein